jgi:hypothetical protein
LRNSSGLTLERGPVTVLAEGEYVGEAILPFTPAGGEMIVPYAVELGVKIHEESGSSSQTHAVSVQNEFLVFETWDIRWRRYTASNTTGHPQSLLVEHPRSSHFEVFDTPDAAEKTADLYRFQLLVPPHGEANLRVNERRLVSRREEIRRQSLLSLQKLLNQGLVREEVFAKLSELLGLWEKIEKHNKTIAELSAEREKIYRQQSQIQGNLNALKQEGKEGALRARYVRDLEGSEERLREIEVHERQLKEAIRALEEEIQLKVAGL